MARRLSSRLKIAGKLVAETPLHVGGYGDSPDTDLPLAQNGEGDWYVPGTSIAGVLRNWCCQRFRHIGTQGKKSLIDDVFGFQDGDQGHASFVLIEDAPLENADKVLTEIRDGVGIDRFYGVAADKAKYDRAVLPRGSTLDFSMTVEIEAKKDPNKKAMNVAEQKGESDADFESRVKRTKAVIGHLLKALTASKVRLGAAKTRGLGRIKLESFSIKEQSFIGYEILDTLNGGGQPQTVDDLVKADESTQPDLSPCLEIKIKWHPRLPVMVKAGYDGIGVDMLPLTSGVRDGELALCLPGGSIKGVLRSHAERIMRTLLDCADQKDELGTKNKSNFHDQIDSIPLIEKLFGARSKSASQNSKPPANKYRTNLEVKPGLGALTIDDCYAGEKHQMKIDAWRAVEIGTVDNDISAEQWDLHKKLKAISNVSFHLDHHVAIDRWTGGASEGALYSVLAPTEISWEEMRLTLDFGRIDKESQLPALMLLLLVLRDVAENRLPFGFATNRGMGEIAVETFEFVGNGSLQLEDSEAPIHFDLADAISATIVQEKCKFKFRDEDKNINLKTEMQKRWNR